MFNMMKLKKILAIVSAMTCMFAVTSPIYAYSDCSVTVKMAHTADEPVHKTEPVSGASVTLSKVATLEADGTYKSLDKFSDVLKTFDVTTAAENIALSKKLADVADTGITKTTGRSGTAIFNGLSKGVYLVQETGRTGEASYYTLAEPYLIAVPYDLKGYAQNTVVTAPKIVPLSDLDNGNGDGDNGDRNKDKDQDKQKVYCKGHLPSKHQVKTLQSEQRQKE